MTRESVPHLEHETILAARRGELDAHLTARRVQRYEQCKASVPRRRKNRFSLLFPREGTRHEQMLARMADVKCSPYEQERRPPPGLGRERPGTE